MEIEEAPSPDQRTRGDSENTSSVADYTESLSVARELIEAGIPVFVARPATDADGGWDPAGGHNGTGYWLPSGWQKTEPDLRVLDGYRPGYALAMVCGHKLDGLDTDPCNGGDESRAALEADGTLPQVYGWANTPSGGTHELVATMGIRSRDKVRPGLDIKAGDPDGAGRGFLFIAPTRKRSKVDGTIGEYRWGERPDLAALAAEGPADRSGEALAALIGSLRKPKVPKARNSRVAPHPASDAEVAALGGNDERAALCNGAAPDARQRAYLDTVLVENAGTVAEAAPGGRNDALYHAALKCASLVAGAGMDQRLVTDILEMAAADCGLVDDDGIAAVHATIASAFGIGLHNPRAVPNPDPPVIFDADPNAPAASNDYPINPYPPFTADDFRQLAPGVTVERRAGSRVRQVVCDAELDHPVKHQSYEHPWCPACLDAWAASCGPSTGDMDSSRVARSRAARYLLLHNNPPADTFVPDLHVENLDEEFLRADQLDELPAPEPLIDGVLTRHAYGIIRGRDQTFKSFITLDWALCLATGTRWQGRATERVKVLYVAGEGAHSLGARKRAWEEARNIRVDPEWFVVRKSAVNLYRTGPAFDHLLRHIESGGYGFVVFDTLRRMSGGADGNGSDMGVVIDNMDKVKRLTAEGSVMAAAHTDKGDTDTRGFSGIEDDADIVWSVKRERGTKEVRLTCVKMKDGDDGHTIDLHLRAQGDSLVVERGDPTVSEMFSGSGSGVRDSDEKIMAVMHELFADVGATVADLVGLTGLSQNTVYRSRRRLVDSGRLHADKSRRLFLRPAEAG